MSKECTLKVKVVEAITFDCKADDLEDLLRAFEGQLFVRAFLIPHCEVANARRNSARCGTGTV